jgi:hypothetical protein
MRPLDRDEIHKWQTTSTLATSFADLKDETREKVHATLEEKFKKFTEPAEELAKLEQLELINPLKRAKKERAMLEPQLLRKLGDPNSGPKF